MSDWENGLRETYIETRSELEQYFSRLSSEGSHTECTVDTEADSMHSYATKLCLIQFSVADELAIIDPLSIGVEDLQPFIDYVKSLDTVWMHGADYDMSMFRMSFDWIPDQVWDTQTAARLLGFEKYGLANLIELEYGVKLSKQSQKADWSKRPLSDKMREYAYNDVRYLLGLGSSFIERLKDLNRYDWFVESCAAARTSAEERDEKSKKQVWRINGWGKLDRKGLHFLKALWIWRDSECEKLDRPAFKFLGNQELIYMAQTLSEGGTVKPPHFLRPAYVKRLRVAIEDSMNVSEEDYPVKRIASRGQRLDVDERLFKEIRDHRDKVAEELSIDPTLIATRTVLERLASKSLSTEEKDSSLLGWQKELLEPKL